MLFSNVYTYVFIIVIGFGLKDLNISDKVSYKQRKIITRVDNTREISPKAARDLLLANIVELCSMNKVHCPVIATPTPNASTIGQLGGTLDPEYGEVLLTKLAYMSPRSEFQVIKEILQEVNSNIPIFGFLHGNKRGIHKLKIFHRNYSL